MENATHDCGGTVLVGGQDETRHVYCDRCGAFNHNPGADTLPSGTDRDANRAAFDAGHVASPDARPNGPPTP